MAPDDKPYTFLEHRQNFAVWAAARATQRGWKKANTKILGEALKQCDVYKFVDESLARDTATEKFEQLHRKWCNQICKFLKYREIPSPTYGRAAKLLAVYLKSMLILSGPENCPLARSAHPPIDRTLLQNLAKSLDKSSPCYQDKAYLKSVSWTELNEDKYFKLIKLLRSDQPFWKLERFWNKSGTSDE